MKLGQSQDLCTVVQICEWILIVWQCYIFYCRVNNRCLLTHLPCRVKKNMTNTKCGYVPLRQQYKAYVSLCLCYLTSFLLLLKRQHYQSLLAPPTYFCWCYYSKPSAWIGHVLKAYVSILWLFKFIQSLSLSSHRLQHRPMIFNHHKVTLFCRNLKQACCWHLVRFKRKLAATVAASILIYP